MRSLLYVPAHRERFVANAHERGADAIILDLEDAVPLDAKDEARAALETAVPAVTRDGAAAFVRINAEPARADVDAEAGCRAGAFGLLVPKAKDPARLVRLASLLARIEAETGRAPTQLVPVLEDAGAVLDARAIASATPRVYALLAGSEDLATSMGAEPTPEVLHLPKLLVHLAAKAAGVRSLGLLRSVADYGDIAAIEAAAKAARAFGFDGATCVHPAVVPVLNRAFAPSAEEVARARRLLAAYEEGTARGLGAVAFEGSMVDKPVPERARALLARDSQSVRRGGAERA